MQLIAHMYCMYVRVCKIGVEIQHFRGSAIAAYALYSRSVEQSEQQNTPEIIKFK